MANYYNETVKATLQKFSTDPEKGLSTKEALKRQSLYGPNILKTKTTPLWRKLIAPFADIFMLILLAALVLSLFQGDWLEAVAIGVIIIADAIIYYIQRFSTDRILESLKNSTKQDVTVLRDGREESLDSSELVPGDIAILGEGDRVPADGRIISESGLLSDESMLTGESEPIAKDAKAISGSKKVYEQRNMVFSGAFIVTGRGKYVVVATGNDTEYGRIASLASSVESTSPISEKINRLVIKIAIVVIVVAVIALVVQLLDGVELVSALKFTLAMIVSAVPEGMPIAISIVLALCAKRMARKQALIKELSAIESLGIVTTIASDKTGTLTENRLTLQDTWLLSPRATFRDILSRATLRESSTDPADFVVLDPLDLALSEYLATEAPTPAAAEPLHSYAFDQSLKMSGNLFPETDRKFLLAVKGAPETILARSDLDSKTRLRAEAKLVELASQGYKVIALAHATIAQNINELHRLDPKIRLTLDGFVAVADNLRREAGPAIKQAARMGVQTKMVTGDHASTAYAIGRHLGLARSSAEVLDCSKLGNINDSDLEDLVKTTTIFARVTPEDKFRILEAIKKTEICAMTGDGVNDVPALVGAHVGIAMGDSPSIVQDAGDIVLLDNNFRNITGAIQESRTVLANIRRMLSYLLATNAGEALTMIGALLLFGSQMLTPIQILWINLVTDSLLVIPLGLEPPEASVLHEKPDHKDAPILPLNLIIRMIILAVTMSVVTLATYFIARLVLHSDAEANTLAFTALVVMQWSGALTARGIHESVATRLRVRHHGFYLALFMAILLQLAALFGPLAHAINVVSVPFSALALVSVIAFLCPLLFVELYKKFAKF